MLPITLLWHTTLRVGQPQGQSKSGEGHEAEVEAQAATNQIRILLGQCRKPLDVSRLIDVHCRSTRFLVRLLIVMPAPVSSGSSVHNAPSSRTESALVLTCVLARGWKRRCIRDPSSAAGTH